MIQEQYVSFETAKLLKEKGFNIPCRKWYTNKGFSEDVKPWEAANNEVIDDFYSMPTQQMAMRWLREVHNLYITVSHRFSHNGDDDVCFSYYINTDLAEDGEWLTYEEAAEAAIRYCLENLI